MYNELEFYQNGQRDHIKVQKKKYLVIHNLKGTDTVYMQPNIN